MRFGIASCDIVPPFATSMGGYGIRQEHFRGVSDRLQFTALVLEAGKQRVLIGCADLINWPNDGTTERLIDRLAVELDISPAHVLLNASHTHGGPKVPGVGMAGNRGDVPAAERYAEWLCERVVETARQATRSMREGTIHLHAGNTMLAINRRLDAHGEVLNAPNPMGSIDDTLQVLVIRDSAAQPAVVIARASCHPVATGAQYLITADYVGAWRQSIRGSLGEHVTPMFLQGAAGDMRPHASADGDGWRALAHEELPAIGRSLADDTLRAITSGTIRRLSPLKLQGRLHHVIAKCEPKFVRADQLKPLLTHPRQAERAYAASCLDLLHSGQAPASEIGFRVHTLWLTDHFCLVGLNCEPLHAVGSAIEQALRPAAHAMVVGYTGGCLCYAPDTAELRRGGYEAESYLYEMWAGPWVEGFEKTFTRPEIMARP